MATTISDLKESTAETLTAITDGTTEANALYVENKIISPIRDLGRLIPTGQVLLGNLQVDNFQYTNLQTIIDNLYNAYPGVNYDLEILIVSSDNEVEQTISTPNGRIKIRSEFDKYQINPIVLETSGFNSMAFENVVLTNNYGTLSFTNCYFKNCILSMANEQLNLIGCIMDDCLITNGDSIILSVNSDIHNSKIKAGDSINFSDDTCKMYGCFYNCSILNEENNLTQGLNTYAENL